MLSFTKMYYGMYERICHAPFHAKLHFISRKMFPRREQIRPSRLITWFTFRM